MSVRTYGTPQQNGRRWDAQHGQVAAHQPHVVILRQERALAVVHAQVERPPNERHVVLQACVSEHHTLR